MSGLRFVRHAAEVGKPVVIINRGSTRGDEFATVKVGSRSQRGVGRLAAELPDLAGQIRRLVFPAE